MIVLNSFVDYLEYIFSVDSQLKRDGIEFNEMLLFRGHNNIEYELIPSIGRGRKNILDSSIFDEERNLIASAKMKRPDVFNSTLYPVELLALLQHYGIPTRLLDVTENPLVALYFACAGMCDADGEIFIFKHDDRSKDIYPVYNAIADSYRFARGSFYALSLFFGGVKHQRYFDEWININSICHDTDEKGGAWIKECCNKVLFINSPVHVLRQEIQSGRYILFPNRIEEDSFVSIIDPIEKDSECIVERIIIPRDKKRIFLKQLQVLGISEEKLFSDSIDYVCKGIRNYYSERRMR